MRTHRRLQYELRTLQIVVEELRLVVELRHPKYGYGPDDKGLMHFRDGGFCQQLIFPFLQHVSQVGEHIRRFGGVGGERGQRGG